MRSRHLREADSLRKLSKRALVLRIAVAMHEHDCARANALRMGRAQLLLRSGEIQLTNDSAMRAPALVDFDHRLVKLTRQLDAPDEQLGPVLIGNPQRVRESPSGYEQRSIAFALKQCVCG